MNKWDSEQFQSPANRYRPKLRWWLPGAFMDNEEIKREIEWMAGSGYGGAELIHFFSIPPADMDPSEFNRYGFGGEEWNNRMKSALEAAIPLSFQLDFTVGPLWPIATPAVMDKNDERCAQGLHVGTALFEGTYHGEIPVPDTIDLERPRKLVAVTAARKFGGRTGKVMTLELETAAVLSSAVEGDHIEWLSPGDGEWCLFGFWSQTNLQMNDSIGAPVVDHYSRSAAKAVTDFWDDRLFADPDIRALYEKNAGSLFCDSIELNATMLGGMYGATPMPVAIWSPSVLEEFRTRRGYDLTPYLPSLFVKGLYQLGAGNRTDGDSEYDFEDRAVNRRIRNDFFATLTDMFRENHLRTLRQWANGHNMKLRYQTYGMPTELTSGLSEVDIPETESLGFKDSTDGYRLQSGAVHLYDRPIYSFEVGAVMGYGYKQTWTGQDFGLLWQLHRGYAAGINQAVLHGMSYETSSASGHFAALFKWPGLSLMGSMFSNEWGPRQPNARHTRIVADYIARTQYVLQLGKPKVDLAIYRYHIDGIHHGMGTELTPYEQAGYTYDFVSPCLLEETNVYVKSSNGLPALAADGPTYRAIVVDLREEMDEGGGQIPSDLPVETAERLIAFAEAGLPVVIVGEAPRHVVSLHGDREKLSLQDALLRERIVRLQSIPKVRHVQNREEAVKALQHLEVSPACEVCSGIPLLSARRYEEDVNYYYLYNPSSEQAFDGELRLAGNGEVYAMNAWDGTVRQLSAKGEEGCVRSKLRLAPNGTALLAVTRTWEGAFAKAEYEAATGDIRIMPERWSLSVDSWTAGEHPTKTQHELIELELTELQSWTEIPELKNVSGIGTYRTSFRLESIPIKQNAVVLDLGRVSDTFKVYINGRELPAADQIGRRIPIGNFVCQGEENRLEIEVATTLNNALCADDGNRQPLECGLMGPVVILLQEGL
ncbi:glycosyl hydrolase [Paenibacillus sp. FSL K6-1566]|uniref:glycosyl hydrolase n=1 Tax=Paenibacillus sp. FSL K6-1566 TaxID=2954515 RepID=UPI0031013046